MNSTDAIILSALGGAGLYGATRMLHNTMGTADHLGSPAEQNGVASDKIVIKLPKKHDPNAPVHGGEQLKQAELSPVAAIPLSLAAFATSFYGANKLHDAYKKHEASKDLEEANTKYNEALQKLQNQKVASSTPIVDAMCEKIAEEIEKTGTDYFNSISNAFPTYPWNKTPQGNPQWGMQETEVPVFHQAAEGVKNWGMDNFILPAGGILASYGALKYLADRTKNKREEDAAARSKLPTQIVIDQS